MEDSSSKEKYIRSLELDDLEKAIDQDDQVTFSSKDAKIKFDSCPEELTNAEMEYIRAWRSERGSSHDDNNSNLTGLALSGGGIRSATFSLGVMQALASRDVLKRMDYLSTVSGGGYIGSALTWLLSDTSHNDLTASDKQANSGNETDLETQDIPRFGLDAQNFPYGTDDPDPAKPKQASESQRRMLKYLREHGYYLTPGSGINALSLLGIVLRGTFLNLVVWMPVFVLFFVFGMLMFENYKFDIVAVLPTFMSPDSVEPHLLGFKLFLWLGIALSGLLMVSTLLYSILTLFSRGHSTINSIHSWLNRKLGLNLPNWYQMRRFSEKLVPGVLTIIILSVLVGSLPVIAATLKTTLADAWTSVGPMAMLSGLVVAMRDFMKPADDSNSASSGILAPLAAGLFIFGGFLIAYELANWVFCKPLWYSVVLLMIALIFGFLVNLNYISIHRYYRDRLMESFMPDISSALGNETGEALGANTAKLTDFAYQEHNTAPRSPYHIVNTNVILTDSKKRIYKNRGGDSFILSPLYCGSNATGWCRTKNFVDGKMTLATAVAISGAAANPNTGVGGVGVTRNHMISFVMALLNLKLGYWAEHPDPGNYLGVKHTPNHFHPGLYHFLNLIGWGGFKENRAFVHLSDGGHFENTGVYELVRRRTKLIIVCDGGADAEFSFSDFQTTIRRIEDDFGARVKVLDEVSPDQIVPFSPVNDDESGIYPKDAKFAKQGHMMGHIMYANGSEGWLIFLKTTLIKDVTFKVKGYAAQNKDFPDQSTADQFFDEVQFEAYRELGYRLTIKMLESSVPQGVTCEGLSEASSKKKQSLEQFIKTCSA